MNLAHCHRKARRLGARAGALLSNAGVAQLGSLKRALTLYDAALSLRPNNAHTLICIAVTHHVAGRLAVRGRRRRRSVLTRRCAQLAIEQYHAALGLRRDNMMASDMLALAVQQRELRPLCRAARRRLTASFANAREELCASILSAPFELPPLRDDDVAPLDQLSMMQVRRVLSLHRR